MLLIEDVNPSVPDPPKHMIEMKQNIRKSIQCSKLKYKTHENNPYQKVLRTNNSICVHVGLHPHKKMDMELHHAAT